MKRSLLVLVVVLLLASVLAAPVLAGTQATQTVSYTVKNGDTLAKIGRQYCTTWEEIYRLNRAVIGPNPNVLVPGMVLQVPNRCGSHCPPGVYDRGPTRHAHGAVNGNVYAVGLGDTMYSISKRFGLTIEQLAAANGIRNPWWIYAGQKLVIPCLGGGPIPGKPFVTISSPAPGSVLPPTFTANGTGGGLFEGGLVVRAEDAAGRTLAQQPATLQGADGGMGGSGTWSVQLTVNVTQPTQGRIVAFATSPRDGSVVASAAVPVTFSPASGGKPFVTISSPAAGSVLPPTFTANGTGGGLFEGALAVRAEDTAGRVLAQQPTILQGTDVGTGGSGTWSVQLTVNVTQPTQGRIVAFAASPRDGSVVASAAVAVTFSPASGGKPFVTISSPAPGSVLPPTFAVKGTGGGLFEGGLVVRAQDMDGNVLAEQPTTLQGVEGGMGGSGTWSVQLTVRVTRAMEGKIVAYSTSPADGRVVASAGVVVTFNPPPSQ